MSLSHGRGRARIGALVAALLLLAGRAEAASGPVIHILAGDLPPFSIEGATDKPGFLIELTREASRRAEIPFEPQFAPWSRVQRDARSFPNHMIIGLTRTEEREEAYLWIADLARVDTVFLTRSNQPPVNSFADAAKLSSITVRADTPFEAQLLKRGIRQITTSQTEESNARKLKTGRSDAWFTYALRGLWVWVAAGYSPSQLAFGHPVGTETLYLAANRDFPAETALRLNLALKDMREDGAHQRIYDRYFKTTPP